MPAGSRAGSTETARVRGVVRVPEGETESQVIPPVDPDALTENRIDLYAETEIDCCWIAVLPAVTVNDSEVGEIERVDPLCSPCAKGIAMGIIVKSAAA